MYEHRYMTAKTLPRLLSRKTLASELGITLSAAEAIMRTVPKVKIGARVFVREPDVRRYLRERARA